MASLSLLPLSHLPCCSSPAAWARAGPSAWPWLQQNLDSSGPRGPAEAQKCIPNSAAALPGRPGYPVLSNPQMSTPLCPLGARLPAGAPGCEVGMHFALNCFFGTTGTAAFSPVLWEPPSRRRGLGNGLFLVNQHLLAFTRSLAGAGRQRSPRGWCKMRVCCRLCSVGPLVPESCCPCNL